MGKKASKRAIIPNIISILARSESINKKELFGHWESDSIVCLQSTVSLNVMIEHQTQYVSIRQVENREAEVANEDSLNRFKAESKQSIRWIMALNLSTMRNLKKCLILRPIFVSHTTVGKKDWLSKLMDLLDAFYLKN
jgi:IS30 family transposase